MSDQPTITLSSTAYLKLQLLAAAPSFDEHKTNPLASRETAALLITAPDDPFFIRDVFVPKQSSTAASFEIEPSDALELFSTFPDALPCCTNLIFHTHPGESATPSGGDLENWRTVQATGPFAMMLIFGRPSSPTAFPDFSLRVRYPLGPAVIPGYPAKPAAIYDGPAKLVYYCPYRAYLENGTPFPLTPDDRVTFLRSSLAANPGRITVVTPRSHHGYLFSDSTPSYRTPAPESIKQELYFSLSNLNHKPVFIPFTTSPPPCESTYSRLSQLVFVGYHNDALSRFPYYIHDGAATVIRDAWRRFTGTLDDFIKLVLSPCATWVSSGTRPYFTYNTPSSSSSPLVRPPRAKNLSRWTGTVTPADYSHTISLLAPRPDEDSYYSDAITVEHQGTPLTAELTELADLYLEQSKVIISTESNGTFTVRISWAEARSEFGWSNTDISSVNSMLATNPPGSIVLAALLRYEIALDYLTSNATFTDSEDLALSRTELFTQLLTELAAAPSTPTLQPETIS